MSEDLVGVVDHWYGRIKVAGVRITRQQLGVGDAIHIVGKTTDLTLTIPSMQIDHEAVLTASPGDKVGIKVPDRVRVGDEVYRVIET
jgi:putative protease